MELKYGHYRIQSPSAVQADEYDAPTTDKIQPIYPARGSIKSPDFKKFMHALENQIALIPDMIPTYPGRADALLNVHFPETIAEAKSCRDILACEEWFSLLLATKLNLE